MQEGQWEIFHHDNSNFYKECICGHRVKRITYLYDRLKRKIIFIGTTCIKKYGIKRHVNNGILIQVLKENLVSFENINLEDRVKTWVETAYNELLEKVNACSEGIFDYYDIVLPFRRLLTDICELVTEYHFDLIVLLKVIERDVDSMNESTKHYMVDEYDSDSSISTIEYDDDCGSKSEHVFIEISSEMSDIVIDEPENQVEEVSEVSDIVIDEPENQVEEIISEILNNVLNKHYNIEMVLKLSDIVIGEPENQVEEIISERLTLHPNNNSIHGIIIHENSSEIRGRTTDLVTCPSKEFIDYDKNENIYDDDDNSSECSAETMIEDYNDKKSIPIIISELFCHGYMCHPNTHMYCIRKMRMHKLRLDIDEYKNQMQELRKEVYEISKRITDLHYRILYTF